MMTNDGRVISNLAGHLFALTLAREREHEFLVVVLRRARDQIVHVSVTADVRGVAVVHLVVGPAAARHARGGCAPRAAHGA